MNVGNMCKVCALLTAESYLYFGDGKKETNFSMTFSGS